MLQNILQTATSCLFLLLASILIYDRWDSNNNQANIESVRKQMMDVEASNVNYLEGRINRISEISDSYQSNMTRRVNVLEERMKALEAKRTTPARVTNTNTNIVNK